MGILLTRTNPLLCRLTRTAGRVFSLTKTTINIIGNPVKVEIDDVMYLYYCGAAAYEANNAAGLATLTT